MKTLKNQKIETVKKNVLTQKVSLMKSQLKAIKGGSIVEENAEGI